MINEEFFVITLATTNGGNKMEELTKEIAKELNVIQENLNNFQKNMLLCQEINNGYDISLLLEQTKDSVTRGCVILIDWANAIKNKHKQTDYSAVMLNETHVKVINKCEEIVKRDTKHTGIPSYTYITENLKKIYRAYQIPLSPILCVSDSFPKSLRSEIPNYDYSKIDTEYEAFNELIAAFEENVEKWEKIK